MDRFGYPNTPEEAARYAREAASHAENAAKSAVHAAAACTRFGNKDEWARVMVSVEQLLGQAVALRQFASRVERVARDNS